MRSLGILLFVLLSFSGLSQPSGTLLVVNKAENNISLIDLSAARIVATIPTAFGPHEVAVSPSGKWGAVTNYGDAQKISKSITVIDIAKRKSIKTIDLGNYQRPHGIEFINEEEVLITSEDKMVLIKVNIEKASVEEIASTSQQGSHMVAWSPNNPFAYVSNVGSGSVSVIDIENKKLSTVFVFQPGTEGLAITPNGKELWVANRNDSSVTVVNTSNGEELAVLPAHQVAFRVKAIPNGEFVVVSNGLSGNLSIYNAQTRKFLRDIDLVSDKGPQPVPVGIATEPGSDYLFVCLAGYNEVAVISTKDWLVKARITTGKEPDGVYYSKIKL